MSVFALVMRYPGTGIARSAFMNIGIRHNSLVITALVLMLAACGGGDEEVPVTPPAPPPPPPPGMVIGAAGGTVTGPNGTQVVIPAGALASEVRINIEQSAAGAPPLPGGFSAGGLMFAITPHGTAFARPVTVTLPFDPASVRGLVSCLSAVTGSGQATAGRPLSNRVNPFHDRD
jgi:ZU5 domain-containing protein